MPSSSTRHRSRSRSRTRSRSRSRSRSASPAVNEGFSTNMGRQELVQNARELEKKYDKVQDERDELRKENAHLKAKRGRRKGRSRKERAAPPEPDPIEDDEVDELRVHGKHAAQKFLLQCTLFLAPGFSTRIERQRDYDLSPANRFANSEGTLQGQLRDLERILPNDIPEDQRKSATFWSVFNFHFGDHRSQAISRRIRGTASIWGNLHTYLESVKGRHSQRELIGWSEDGWGTGKPGYAALAAPLIHKGNSAPNGFDIRTAFLSEIAMKTYVAMVLGPAAVTSLNTHGVAIPAPGEYIGKTLGIRYTTPSAIALACTATCWAMSEDARFVQQQRAGGTHIDWLEWQNQYQKVLEDGLERGLEEYKKVFRTWDKTVFPATADQGLGGPEPEAPADVNALMMERAMGQMDAAQTARRRETPGNSPARENPSSPREDSPQRQHSPGLNTRSPVQDEDRGGHSRIEQREPTPRHRRDDQARRRSDGDGRGNRETHDSQQGSSRHRNDKQAGRTRTHDEVEGDAGDLDEEPPQRRLRSNVHPRRVGSETSDE